MSRLFEKFKQDITGLLLLASGLFVSLSLISYQPSDPSFNSIGRHMVVSNYCGYVGSFLADGFFQVFGITAWFACLGLFVLSYKSFKGEGLGLKKVPYLWGSSLVLTLSALTAVYFPHTRIYQDQIFIGGILGLGLSQTLIKVFNPIGLQIILWTMACVLMIFFSEKTINELVKYPKFAFAWLKEKASGLLVAKAPQRQEPAAVTDNPVASRPMQLILPDEETRQAETPPFAEEAEPVLIPIKTRKVTLKMRTPQRVENWDLPKLSLLEDPPVARIKIDRKEIEKKAEILKEKLQKFEVTGEVVAAKPGPAVTMFEFKPDASVKVSEITSLADDLSLALSSESLRILAPIPGRDVVGIETSNAQRETVYLKDMLAAEEFWKDEIRLPIALGKTSTGEAKIVDLRRMPHLMVAGTTGSGKSVFTVSMITGLLFRHSPKTLKLIIVDPKQVDYSAFEKIPHLAVPIITDTKQAVISLKWTIQEMEKRYKSMSRFGAKKLEDFNDVVSKLSKEEIEQFEAENNELASTPGKKNEQYFYSPLPYIVIILEEFGDLMVVDKASVEPLVVRLAQKARACGIHLVLAMQSPRKEVVTGQIKMNIPGRIAFKVSSSMDSRIILDDTGAERLLANGDMLFKSPGHSSLIRHHGPFLKDTEISGVARFWAAQAPEPEYDQSALSAIEGQDGGEEFSANTGEASEYDDRYDEILAWASMQKTISASLIQRRFSIGYPRAARIIETFEQEGVVGPANGSKPRQVLVGSLEHLDR
jgi:DNA segregation ATPase FtsK/SpoIIIE, S-DNA-T family